MISNNFRIKSSLLIEHYQYIEAHLESIYASISEKNWFDGLKDVEEHSLTRLVKELKQMDLNSPDPVLSSSDYQRLEHICKRRNFWVHNAYYDLAFDAKTGNLRKQHDADMMNRDISDAESMRKYLFDIWMRQREKYKDSINEEINDSFKNIVNFEIVDIEYYDSQEGKKH